LRRPLRFFITSPTFLSGPKKRGRRLFAFIAFHLLGRRMIDRFAPSLGRRPQFFASHLATRFLVSLIPCGQDVLIFACGREGHSA
jgi:hypothetical protein